MSFLGGPFGYGGFGGLGGGLGGFGLGGGYPGVGFGGYPGGMNYVGSEYDIAKHPELDGVNQSTWHQPAVHNRDHDNRNFVSMIFGGGIVLGIIAMLLAHRQDANFFKRSADTFRKTGRIYSDAEQEMVDANTKIFGALKDTNLRNKLSEDIKRYAARREKFPDDVNGADDTWKAHVEDTFNKFTGGKDLHELDHLPHGQELRKLRGSLDDIKYSHDKYYSELAEAKGKKHDIQLENYMAHEKDHELYKDYLKKALEPGISNTEKQEHLQRVRDFYSSKQDAKNYASFPEGSFTKEFHDFIDPANTHNDDAARKFLSAHERMFALHRPHKENLAQLNRAVDNFNFQLGSLSRLKEQAPIMASPPPYPGPSRHMAPSRSGRSKRKGGSKWNPMNWRKRSHNGNKLQQRY